MRRNRFSEFSRRLVRENTLSAADFIYPMFVVEGTGQREPIASMPGIDRVSIDLLKKEVEELLSLGQLYDRDLSQARMWFERAANGGNVLAMHRLGVMAARGEGGPVDIASSVSWFEKAATFGLVDSQYNLGATFHPTPEGAAGGFQDRAKAYFWYSIAAKNGDAQAGEMAAGLAATMPEAEKSAKDAEVAAWAAKTPDPAANELATTN